MPSLTSKELSAIEDQLGVEQTLIKKYQSYAAMSNDSQIKTKCEQIASLHQQHYNTLLQLLSQ